MKIDLQKLVDELHSHIEALGSPVKNGVRDIQGSWDVVSRVNQQIFLTKAAKAPLGSGSYSMVFETEDRKALKIGFCPQDGGLAYAAWCRANQHHSAVPLIYGIASTEYCYAVLMEKLEPWDGEEMLGQWEQHRNGMTGGAVNCSALGLQLGLYFKGVGELDANPDNFMVRRGRTDQLVLVDGVGQIGCSRLTTDGIL